jgi:hypothetical protein
MMETDTLPLNCGKYGILYSKTLIAADYFKRSTNLYGVSNTGKTVIVRAIMDVLKSYVPNVLVVSPTASSSGDFEAMVPERCILKNPTSKLLKDITERQIEATDLFRGVNDLKRLEDLFKKTNDHRAFSIINRIKYMRDVQIRNIEFDGKFSEIKRREQIKEVTKHVNATLRRIYKQYISMHKEELLRGQLDENEKKVLKYLYLNPCLLLIMDDCASMVKEWGKDETLKKLFYQGRHFMISTIFTWQADRGASGPDGEIRKNAFNNIFTDSTSANGFIQNTVNGFTTDFKKRGAAYVNSVFADSPDGSINYKKLVYNRLLPTNQFGYIVAPYIEKLHFGCKQLYQLCDGISRSDNNDIVIKKDSRFIS